MTNFSKITFDKQIERLITISKKNPLLPEKFVPWEDPIKPDTNFLPEFMISLQGHPLWETLSKKQQVELGRLEIVQVMYSYGWSEGLATYFFNRHLLTLKPQDPEYRFLLREIIEECRHQEMFSMAILKLERSPIMPTTVHKWVGHLIVKYGPPSVVFMSVLAIEMMADIYAKHIRKDPSIYSVLRKSSELHHIEEGRHIFYTEAWLKKFTDNAGFSKSTYYSLIVLLNLVFLKTLYVQRSFFEQLNVPDPDTYFKAAKKQFHLKFETIALDEIKGLVHKFNGFNWVTRPFWSLLLNVKNVNY